MVLKRTEMFVFGGGALRTFSSDSPGQLDISGHDGDSLGMNGTQIGVLEQTDEIGLCCLLTGSADLSCSLGQFPSLISGRAAYG